MSLEPRISPTIAGWTAYALHLLLSDIGRQQAPAALKPELAAWRLFWTQAAQSGMEWPSSPDPATEGHDVPVLLTYEAAGHLLSVSERKVRELADNGDLPRVRIGRSARIHRDDLNDYADQLRGTDDV